MAKQQQQTNKIRQDISFKGGMNLDISKGYLKEDAFPNGRNMRLMGEKENGYYELNNITGSTFIFKVSNVVHQHWSEYTPCTSTVSVLITGNGLTTTYNINLATYTTLLELITAIKDKINLTNIYHCEFYSNHELLIYSHIGRQITSITVTTGGSPTITSTYYNNQKINGYANIRNEALVLLTTNDYLAIPVSWSCVFEIIFDDTSEPVSAIQNLRYIGDLKLSLSYPIDIKVSYENSDLRKIYWTNYYNYPGMLNLDGDNFDKAASELQFINECDFQRIKLEGVNSGGQYNSGVVMYCYQYFNEYGQISGISNITNPIHLTQGSSIDGTSLFYKGVVKGTNTGKSVTMSISSLDTRFTHIRVIAIFCDEISTTPMINILKNIEIPTSGSITFTDDGVSYSDTMTYTDIITISQVLFKCRNFEVKDNRLFPSDIEYEYFDVDFDARVYRFKNDGGTYSAKVYNGSNGSTTYAEITDPVTGGGTLHDPAGDTSIVDWNIPEDYDCICVKDMQRTYQEDSVADYGYCYTSTGSRLGATGKNIEIGFKLIGMKIGNNWSSESKKIFVHGTETQAWSNLLNTYFDDNAGFTNFASPINQQQLAGYCRDEVYRLGIVLRHKKGMRSFVKWMCDIKMPSISDQDVIETFTPPGSNHFHTYNTFYLGAADGEGNKDLFINSLGLSIKVSNFPTDIVGYEVVCVKRENKDKTIVSQGITNFAQSFAFTTATWNVFNLHDGADDLLSDQDITSRTEAFMSPEILFNTDRSAYAGDRMRVVGGLGTGDRLLYDQSFIGDVDMPGDRYYRIVLNKYIDMYPFFHQENTYQAIIDPKITTEEDLSVVVNSKTIHCLAKDFDSAGDETAQKGTSLIFGVAAAWNYTYGGHATYVSGTDKKLVNHERVLTTQYGGNTYYDRLNNVYYSTGLLIKDDFAIVGTERYIFGGDTYICYFDLLASMIQRVADYEAMYVYYVPVETTINLNLRHDTCISTMDVTDTTTGFYKLKEKAVNGLALWEASYPETFTDLYLYNIVYSRLNNILPLTPKPQFFQSTMEYDGRLIASNYKTNNEVIDNWTQYQALNYKDVESMYGKIRATIFFRNKMIVFQDYAICIPAINDRSLIKDSTGNDIVLGSTGLLDRIDYVTTEYGTINKESIIPTENGLYFFDYKSRGWCVLNETVINISEKLGFKTYLDDHTNKLMLSYSNTQCWIDPTTADVTDGLGAYGVYDPKFKEVLLSIKNQIWTPGPDVYTRDQFTLPINESFGVLNPFYDYDTPLYIKTWNHLFMIKQRQPNVSSSDSVYLCNYGDKCNINGTVYHSEISILFNKGYPFSKVFDSVSLIMNVLNSSVQDQWDTFFESIQCYNDFQNTGVLTLVKKTFGGTLTSGQCFYTRNERSFNISIPLNGLKYTPDQMKTKDVLSASNIDLTRLFRERMRDKYLIVKLVFDNANNYDLNISNISSDIRMSYR